MTRNGSMRDTLGWIIALVGGTWLSMKVARWVAETVPFAWQGGPGEPVREIVQEVLEEHRADDTSMVHAFEEALEAEETELADERAAI